MNSLAYLMVILDFGPIISETLTEKSILLLTLLLTTRGTIELLLFSCDVFWIEALALFSWSDFF
jgi:hypothetical protein